MWDPASLSLRLFCLFSPGHVLVYWILLPAALEGSRPSVAISTIIVLIGLLSTQLYMLQTYFVQQSKDSSVLHKEVLNEYDIKFVHPRTQKHVRDVGTQFTSSREATEGLSQCKGDDNYVDLYTPIIAVNRGFHTQPNPHYVSHLDPGAPKLHTSASVRASSGVEPGFQTPDHPHDESSPLRSSAATRQPNLGICRPGDGGSLGVYSHANSPLRKAPSANFVEAHRQRERSLKPVKRINGAYERYGSVEGLGGLGLLQTHSHSARRGRARSGERI